MNLLTTAAACDELLAEARDEKRGLERRIYNLQFTVADSADASAARAASLTAADLEVQNLTSFVATLPDGDLKKKQQSALRRATDRRDELADTTGKASSPAAVLRRELDLAQAQAELDQLTAFIAALEARKAAL